MKVDNPRFSNSLRHGSVDCKECPFADADGFCEQASELHGLCATWGRNHSFICPTEKTYNEACLLAYLAQQPQGGAK